jgi:hypothetical protein
MQLNSDTDKIRDEVDFEFLGTDQAIHTRYKQMYTLMAKETENRESISGLTPPLISTPIPSFGITTTLCKFTCMQCNSRTTFYTLFFFL